MRSRILIASIALLMLFSTNLKAQDYLDKIVEQACDCVGKLSEDLCTEGFTMQAGLCIIQAAEPYSKKLMKDYDIDLS